MIPRISLSSATLAALNAKFAEQNNDAFGEVQPLQKIEFKQVISQTKDVHVAELLSEMKKRETASRSIEPKPAPQRNLQNFTPMAQDVIVPESTCIESSCVPGAVNEADCDDKPKDPPKDNFIERLLKRSGQKLPVISVINMIPIALSVAIKNPYKLVGSMYIVKSIVAAGFDLRIGLAYQNSAFFSKTGESEYAGFNWKDIRGEVELRLPAILLASASVISHTAMKFFWATPKTENNQNPEYVNYKTIDFLNKSAFWVSAASAPLQRIPAYFMNNQQFKYSAAKIKVSDSIWNIWNKATGKTGDGVNRFQVGLSVDTDIASNKLGRLTWTNGVEIRFDKETPVAAYYTGVKQYINLGTRVQKIFPGLSELEFNGKIKIIHQDVISGETTLMNPFK